MRLMKSNKRTFAAAIKPYRGESLNSLSIKMNRFASKITQVLLNDLLIIQNEINRHSYEFWVTNINSVASLP